LWTLEELEVQVKNFIQIQRDTQEQPKPPSKEIEEGKTLIPDTTISKNTSVIK